MYTPEHLVCGGGGGDGDGLSLPGALTTQPPYNTQHEPRSKCGSGEPGAAAAGDSPPPQNSPRSTPISLLKFPDEFFRSQPHRPPPPAPSPWEIQKHQTKHRTPKSGSLLAVHCCVFAFIAVYVVYLRMSLLLVACLPMLSTVIVVCGV